MSPHAVNNFVSDLVLMAQAMEKLPQVQAELDSTKAMLDASQEVVLQRELHIIDLKTEIDRHLATIRSLEVAKDQAETMFLELDEKAGKVLDEAGIISDAVALIRLRLEPPKAQEPKMADIISGYPYGEPEPIVETVRAIEPKIETGPVTEHDWQQDKAETTLIQPQGQSEADPTSADTEGQSQTAVSTTEPVAAHSTSTSWASPAPDTKPSYDNEPEAKYSKAWFNWADRMDNEYGIGLWPMR